MPGIHIFYRLLMLGSGMIFCTLVGLSMAVANQEELFDFTILFPNPPKNSVETEKAPEQRNTTTQAGTTTVCPSCRRSAQSASTVKDLSNIAANTRRRQRAPQIVQPYVEPKYEGPNPDRNVWQQFPEIAAYSDSKDVETAIRIAKRNMNRASTGFCYRYVKNAIFNSSVKLTSHRLGSNRVFPNRKKWKRDTGVGAIENFEREGFVNLMTEPTTRHLIKNPASAPKGAILIYRGGNEGGHIEIKTDYGTRGGYVSDFMNSSSIMQNELAGRSSRRYQLVGVMVKPMKKAL